MAIKVAINGFGRIGRLVFKAMQNEKNMEFLEFVTRDKLDMLLKEQNLQSQASLDNQAAAELGKKIGVSAFVVGKVNSVITDYPPESKTNVSNEADIYQGKDKPKRHVTALVTITTRKGKAIVKCSYQIIDVNKGTITKSGAIDKTVESVIQFGRYDGAEDALSQENRDLCSKEDQFPPNEELLVEQAIEDAAAQLAQEITSYYK